MFLPTFFFTLGNGKGPHRHTKVTTRVASEPPAFCGVTIGNGVAAHQRGILGAPNNLAKLEYFTNLDFPERRRFPFLGYLLE